MPPATAGTSRAKRQTPQRAVTRRLSPPAATAPSRAPRPNGPSRLRLVRVALSLTQLEVARRVGIAVSTLSMVEKGHWVPTPALVSRLARTLRVTPRTIFPQIAGGERNEGNRPDAK